MATIKSYTDLEQSRKLAEILPLESADMYYSYYHNPISGASFYEEYPIFHIPINKNKSLPCWSLTALISVLPFVDFTTPQLIGTPKILYRCMYNDDLKSHAYDSPVDACYEMILKLHKLNLL